MPPNNPEAYGPPSPEDKIAARLVAGGMDEASARFQAAGILAKMQAASLGKAAKASLGAPQDHREAFELAMNPPPRLPQGGTTGMFAAPKHAVISPMQQGHENSFARKEFLGSPFIMEPGDRPGIGEARGVLTQYLGPRAAGAPSPGRAAGFAAPDVPSPPDYNARVAAQVGILNSLEPQNRPAARAVITQQGEREMAGRRHARAKRPAK